jgi:PAS domain S-box-containing protein
MSQKTIAHISRALMLPAYLLVLSVPVYAAEPVKIGVQTIRSKAQTLAQWQPLAVALKQAIPERDFFIEPLTNEEMESAVASRQLDFVLTNASNYVLISHRSGLSSPLATLAEEKNGQEVIVFGGVIFTRSGQTKINNLTDLVGKTVAAATDEAHGGYQMQAYELSQAGVRLPQDAKLLFTGLPQDNVVEAVLSGRADVGFVRSGVLEDMAHEDKLDMAQLKIISRQNLPGYWAAVSTHLYPNWPFAALPHIDENLARRVAVALFSLEENTAATRAMRIHGFVIPADYTPVEDMLHGLHLPPFDVVPEITLQDVWNQYRRWIDAALIAFALILFLGYRLWISNLRLRSERRMVLQQQQRLQENEDFLDTIIEHIPNMLFVKDAEHLNFVRFNNAGEKLLGYSRDELIGKNDYDFFPKEQADFFISKDREIIDSGKSLDIPEEPISTRLSGLRYLHTRKIPIFADDGSPRYLLGISEDITEHKREEAELRALKADLEIRVAERTSQLESANKELEAFSYSVSHDLRSPLRAINGFSQMLLEDYSDKLDEEGKRLLNVVRENTTRMGQLIDDILKFSRAGRQDLAFSEINMEKLAHAVVDELQPDSGKVQVEIERIPATAGDPAMMRQVFVNLLSNSIKFSRKKEPAMIKVGGSIKDDEAIYFVKDNGAGFDMKYADKLFGVFQRLHGVNEFEGTGIGLAIVKRIITRHGGRVWAEGNLKEGATIYFALPIK